jgi:DNA-binding GntR family transcriptional regulator
MTKAVNLARHLTQQIEAGHYPVGTAIPTEAQLQQRFDVSRHTVREALRELKSRGLVKARAGIGTVVRAQAPATSFMQGMGTLEEIIQFGEATRMKLLGQETMIADAVLAEELGARAGQELRRISLLRYRPKEALPAGWLHIYLRPEHADVIGEIEGATQPVLRLVERRYHVSINEVVQKIVAATLTRVQARILETKAGKPALHVTRQYFDAQDRLLMATVALYPSDRFSHNSRFRIQAEA